MKWEPRAPVVAYRGWATRAPRRYTHQAVRVPEMRYPMLHSTFASHTWGRGVNEARCVSTLLTPVHPDPHPSPHPTCSCGLHGVPRVDDVEPHSWVAGAVILWGQMYSGGRHIRAQFGEVIALADQAGDTAHVLGSMYGVPVVPRDMLRSIATEHGDELTSLQLAELRTV